MVALTDVRRWDPRAIEQAVVALGAVRDRLAELDGDLAAAGPPPGWIGPAARAARLAHDGATEQLRLLAAGVAATRPSVAGAADAVSAILRDLAAVDAFAAGNRFAIGRDGAVDDQHGAPVDPAGRHALREEIAGRLSGILRRAEQVDRGLTELLLRAADGQLGDRPTGRPPQPPSATPAGIAAWWAGLEPAERDRLLAEHPERIGNLDGLPAAVRDRANRARLPGEIARLDAEIAGAPRPGPLAGQRAALGAVEAALGGPGRQLLLLDVSGHAGPRAAVSVGDVDTADHVAVFTPGFTSTVATDLERLAGDMAGVRRDGIDLLRGAPGRADESVATVAWLGYDVPGVDTIGAPGRSVALPIAARNGGAALAGFLGGIDAARAGHPPHLTALGHSYGSTTTGYALQRAAARADDVVFLGSPGISTGDVADLHVPPGHVHTIEARADPVADLGSFGPDPNHLPGVTQLSARPGTAPDGTGLREPVGHGDYLAQATTSRHNVAAVVAGLPERRILGPSSGFGDFLRSGTPQPW